MGAPAPPPLRGVEQQPRLIQRMESGYESSERNSSSPDRLGGVFHSSSAPEPTDARLPRIFSFHREVGQHKRVLMSGPSWRSVPKSKSSGAILQELPTLSWGGSTSAGLLSERVHLRCTCRRRRRHGLMSAVTCACALPERSELDELQEEVARRARQQEQQRRREAEREAAMGFNPKPSKFMDLDQLQHQGGFSCSRHTKVQHLGKFDAFYDT